MAQMSLFDVSPAPATPEPGSAVAPPPAAPLVETLSLPSVAAVTAAVPVRGLPRHEDSLEHKTQSAIAAIRALFQQGRVVTVAFSGGKDSSVLMHLTLEAAKEAQAAGEKPVVMVFSSDTQVENPEVALLLRKEHDKIRRALTAHGIRHEIVLTEPLLARSWAVRILSGTKLPSFPGGSHECAVDFKVVPMRTARGRAFKEWGKDKVCILIGTRFSESEERAQKMAERGELAHTPYVNEEGEHVMSPLAFWSTDDVWETIGLVRAGVLPSYSDFEETFKLYADAGGTSCAVVSDAITEGMKKARGGCGARFGCYVCVAVANDNSLDTMIETDPQYQYMAGLNRLRNLLADTRYDFSKRYWIQRSINANGDMQIQPDCYSPAFLLDLFRYACSLDVQEQRAARRLGIPPRFRLVSDEAMVVIDALWSLNGYHPPHTALLEWLAIQEGKAFYPVPKLDKGDIVKPQPVPRPLAYPAGATWDGEAYQAFTGFRDLGAVFARECYATRPDSTGLRTLTDGRTVLDLESERRMSVSLESLYLVLDFEMAEIQERHAAPPERWSDGYRFWVSYGTLALSGSQVLEHDDMLRRTQWRARHGFLGEQGNLKAQAWATQHRPPAPAGRSKKGNASMPAPTSTVTAQPETV